MNWLKGQTFHRVIDFGCGNGRHTLEFASRGYEAIGIDYSERNIQTAMQKANDLHVRFVMDDCRTVTLNEIADLALCLYDVVGSFANPEDNESIIRNIYRHLEPGGYLVMSVMNLELTEFIAVHKVSNVRKNLAALASLKPSRIMQSSGNIFDPDHFLLETETGVVYRKEQFENEGELSAEYAIRDKRYRIQEISEILGKIGFEIIECRCVQARHWDKSLNPQDNAAKEILILAKKK